MTIESFKQSGRDLMEGLRARSDDSVRVPSRACTEAASRVADQTSVEAGRRPDSMKAGAQSADIGGDITGYGLGGVGGDGGANRRCLAPFARHARIDVRGPVSCAAGSWMLAKVNRPATLARVRRMGKALLAGLAQVVARHASLAEARGLGLLTAVELAPDAPFAPADLVAAAGDQGLLLVRGGERAVRLLPPLNVTAAEIERALERLESALTTLERQGEGTK